MLRWLPVLVLLFGPSWVCGQAALPLKTVAEASDSKKTSSSQEVLAYCESLAKLSPLVKFSTFGQTTNGQPMPLLVVSTLEREASAKPVVLLTGNIHAGEVDAKEAVLALARDLVLEKDSPILQKLRIVIVPNFNADGNDQFSDKNRTDQNGPPSVGIRANGGGFDLNRDFVKLETPEVRGLVELLNTYDPLLALDGHTTNGSYHRYTLTYDGPRVPAADPKLIAYAQDVLLPSVGEKVKKTTGFDSFTYGDFDAKHEAWLTYGSGPRYGTQLYSLRGSIGILSESYTYASFAERVKASYAFMRGNLEFVAEHLDDVKKLVADAKKPRAKVALRTKTEARKSVMSVKGWEESTKDGKTTRTDQPKDYECRILDQLMPTVEVDRPYAYLIPAEYPEAVNTLRRHGVVVEELREQIELDVESYLVTKLTRAEREFQKHKLVTVDVKAGTPKYKAQPGQFLVRTEQKLGQLASYFLEPQAEDGLTTWNFFDSGLKENQQFPVLRLAKLQPIQTGEPRPLAEKQPKPEGFGLKQLDRFSLSGRALGDITWLEDGEHWLQEKAGQLWKVEARTGKAELFLDKGNVKKSLQAIAELDDAEITRLTGLPRYKFNADRSLMLFSTSSGLVICNRYGTPAIRITKHGKDEPTREEFPTFSPDGKRLAYVRGGNLHGFEIDSGKELAFTRDGGKDEILNGRCDWVYEEEIFNRNGQAYWWSPDSKQIAFLRFDDKPVKKFMLSTQDGVQEAINYPKSGAKNPIVSIGVADIASGRVNMLKLAEKHPADALFARVGWVPGETPAVFAYVQNRVQSWLDFTVWPQPKETPKVLFRDETKAWIEDLGEPKFLKDGSFLILSERSGWKHIYHYGADGKLIRPLTSGSFEVKQIERVDEASGDVYFTGTNVSPTGNHLSLVTLKGDEVQVISHTRTTHQLSLSPKGTLYVDRESDETTPTRSILRELYVKPVRILDTNPVYDREKFVFGKYERRQIPMKDGFVLEAGITYPPDFHESNRYPIWIMTYAGPHAPTVRDGWGGGRVMEQVVAASGVVVLRVDPRSASGKGIQSAWTCYKQFGVQELKDLEESVDWMGKNSWADLSRVGLSGHSYGGYMTAYALTHSKKFSAGIAGAPVTDWAFYDSIYTERYMGLPSENKDGYARSSVVKAAKNLHGKLLIVHGLIDDNVHPQNSLQLMTELQKANREFEVMVYPTFRHGIQSVHYPRTQVQFIRRVFGLTVSP